MNQKNRDTYTWDRAIAHIDGDAFFASCEQATDPSLRGKPIAVGRERGVVTAYSYEAKKLGVSRAIKAQDLKRDFPTVQLVSSSYRKYSLFSARFKEIVSRFSNKIEKTSIDECFVDLTGLDVEQGCSYEELVGDIQDLLYTKLGITFSIGIGPTKTIAKIASGQNKPKGITVVTKTYLEHTLSKLPLSYVSGIGHATVPKLEKLGLYVIGDFVARPQEYISELFSKLYVELHHELQGKIIKPLSIENLPPKSISKIHSFGPKTNNLSYLEAEFSRHAEAICKKLRNKNLYAGAFQVGYKIGLELDTGSSTKLRNPTQNPIELLQAAWSEFMKMYNPQKKYRATQLSVSNLGALTAQGSLFVETQNKPAELDLVTDTLDKKYGTGTVKLGSSMLMAKGNSRPKELAILSLGSVT